MDALIDLTFRAVALLLALPLTRGLLLLMLALYGVGSGWPAWAASLVAAAALVSWLAPLCLRRGERLSRGE